MQITKPNIQCLTTTTLIFVGVLVWALSCGNVAIADSYTDSAHGNTSYGINRSTATCENWPGELCVTGSCAHCHDTFDPDICGNDPNGLMLFASNDSPGSQTDNFCFQCHKDSGSVQVRDGGLKNHTYSKNFGGGTATLTTIYDAFNPTTGATPSSHNLSDVLNHAVGRDIGFTSDTNACLVCHDQHLAQQNYPVTLSGLGGVKTAIRRPLDYASTPTNLWGDEDATPGLNERMLDYTKKYQAPYYAGGSNFEPANDTTTDGSNLPNFKNFCLSECHQRTDVYSTERTDTLTQIDWGTVGDQHGWRHDDGGMGYTLAPYGNNSKNYVLACTDCHEPHGSENEWLLRTCVNGKDNISIPPTGKGKWYDFCTACHEFDPLNPGTNMYHKPEPTSPNGCPDCHYHGHVHF